MSGTKQTPPWWVITLIAGLVSVAFLGSRALWEPTETRYALCALEMLEAGDLLHPTLHGLPHLSKPPLGYWGIAAGLWVFGHGEWGARAFQVPVFVLTALLVALLGQTLWKTPRGRWAGVIYATMFLPVAAAGVLTSDTLLALLETASVCCFALVWFGGRSPRWMILFWIGLGLAFATKGPPGLMPLLGIVCFVALDRRGQRGRVRDLLSPLGILCFLGIGAGWYLLIISETAGALSYFLEHEFFGRVFRPVHDRNPSFFHVFRLYLPAMTVGTMPWLLLWPPLVREIATGRAWSGLRDRPLALFLLCWLLLPLGIFSLAQSKLVLYVLPLFPPLTLLLAKPMVLRRGPWITRRGVALLAAWILVLLAFRLTASRIEVPRDSRVMASFVASLLETPTDRLFSVDRVIHGPEFLLGVRTENLSVEGGRKLDPARYGSAETVFAGMADAAERHVFLFDGRKLDWMKQQLRGRGVECTFRQGPSRYYAALCAPRGAPPLAESGDSKPTN